VSPGEIAALVLLVVPFAPGLWMASRGERPHRLVGLEFASSAVIMALTVLCVAWQQTSELIVPLVWCW
jgi:hypothetical protein